MRLYRFLLFSLAEKHFIIHISPFLRSRAFRRRSTASTWSKISDEIKYSLLCRTLVRKTEIEVWALSLYPSTPLSSRARPHYGCVNVGLSAPDQRKRKKLTRNSRDAKPQKGQPIMHRFPWFESRPGSHEKTKRWKTEGKTSLALLLALGWVFGWEK